MIVSPERTGGNTRRVITQTHVTPIGVVVVTLHVPAGQHATVQGLVTFQDQQGRQAELSIDMEGSGDDASA